MDFYLLVKFTLAFVFVISTMLLLAHGLKKAGLAGSVMVQGGKKRLKIVEYLPLDHRRRLVLVRRDDRDHLLVLGPEGETVIEAGIPVADNNTVELKVEKNV